MNDKPGTRRKTIYDADDLKALSACGEAARALREAREARIEAIRAAVRRGLPVRQVARHAGCSIAMVSNWTSGERRA